MVTSTQPVNSILSFDHEATAVSPASETAFPFNQYIVQVFVNWYAFGYVMFNDAMELHCVDVMYSSGPYWASQFFPGYRGFRDEHLWTHVPAHFSEHSYFYSLV